MREVIACELVVTFELLKGGIGVVIRANIDKTLHVPWLTRLRGVLLIEFVVHKTRIIFLYYHILYLRLGGGGADTTQITSTC